MKDPIMKCQECNADICAVSVPGCRELNFAIDNDTRKEVVLCNECYLSALSDGTCEMIPDSDGSIELYR